jgi:hypothetical protein
LKGTYQTSISWIVEEHVISFQSRDEMGVKMFFVKSRYESGNLNLAYFFSSKR